MTASAFRLRFATEFDIPQVQKFIDDHWRSGHILSRDEPLLRWQHLGSDGQLNFVLGEMNGELEGILGFLDIRHFDPNFPSAIISLALWAIREDRPVTGLAFGLVRFLVRETSPECVLSIGASVGAQRALEMMGFEVGEMSHYAAFNEEYRGATIAIGKWPRNEQATDDVTTTEVIEVPSNDLPSILEQIRPVSTRRVPPDKSWAYLYGRFVLHPYYEYRFLRIAVEGRPLGLMICRQIEAAGSSIFRCVDIMGDLPSRGLSSAIGVFLRNANVEYLDIVHHGLDNRRLEDNGFVDVRGGVISVPGFFEPFIPEPRTLRHAYKLYGSPEAEVQFFLADCDQDRPNMVSD